MGTFKRILVAVDERETGQAASRFAGELSGTFGASVQVFHPAPSRAATHRLQDRELAQAIAAEAGRVEADLIVLGLERRIIGRHHVSGSVRQQLGQMTHVPVMVAPTGQRQTAAVRPVRHERRALIKRLQHV